MQGLLNTPLIFVPSANRNSPSTKRVPVGQEALSRLCFPLLSLHFLPMLALKLVTEPWPLVIVGTLMKALVPYLPPVFLIATGTTKVVGAGTFA